MPKIEKPQEVFGCSLELPCLTPGAEIWRGSLRPKLIFWRGERYHLTLAVVSTWEGTTPKEDRWVSQVFSPLREDRYFSWPDPDTDDDFKLSRRSDVLRADPSLGDNETRSPRASLGDALKITFDLISDWTPPADMTTLTATAAFLRPALDASTRFYLQKVRQKPAKP